MANITKPYTFSSGQVIIAAQHNSNFDTIYQDHNGNISNVNIVAGAGIAYNKLNLYQSILSSDLSPGTVISSTNLPAMLTPPVIFSAHTSATQNIPSSSWTQRTTTWTIDKDSGNYWSSNTYTPLIAGWYQVTYMDAISLNSSNYYSQLAIYKNGSAYAYSAQMNYPATSGGGTPGAIVGGVVNSIIQFNGTTDNVNFYAYTNSTGTNVAQSTGYGYISIVRVY